jgi:hypothetical protein
LHPVAFVLADIEPRPKTTDRFALLGDEPVAFHR